MTEAYERNLAERSLERLGVKSGDNLYINYDKPENRNPLREEIEKRANQIGANVVLREFDREQQRRKYEEASENGADVLGKIEEELRTMEKMDYWIRVRAHDSPTASINHDGKAVWRNWREDVLEERLHNTDWLIIEYPSEGWADMTDMNTEELRAEYASAQLRDWEAVKERDSVLKELLTEASETKIRSKGYELALSLGNEDINSIGLGAHGALNLPDGEVYTQPIVESVEGEYYADVPVAKEGELFEGVFLEFEDGEVVDWSADSGGEFLDDCFKEDPGNRRLGEFGIGTNMQIQADIPNLIFREKQAGTVHIAIGKGYKEGISDPEMANDGQTHLDLITDLREEGSLEIDGETVLKEGELMLDSLRD